MADNKQYITQVQDNGRVMISEAVISTIVYQALNDIEGYVGLSAKAGSEIVELVGKKNWGKGIKVSISENDELSIDCNVVYSFGSLFACSIWYLCNCSGYESICYCTV